MPTKQSLQTVTELLRPKSSSKRRVIRPLPGNRCLAVGVVKSAGFWSNLNTFFISCLFLLNARPRNRSVTGSLHTQPCFRPAPWDPTNGSPGTPKGISAFPAVPSKSHGGPPPPAPPSPPRTPRTSHVWKQSPTSGAAHGNPERVKTSAK